MPPAIQTSRSAVIVLFESVAVVFLSAMTNAVVASCVVLVPAVAVGAVGVPVKTGDADKTTDPVPVDVVTPVPPFATANAAPDQFELLMLDSVANEPRPRVDLAVGASASSMIDLPNDVILVVENVSDAVD